MASTLETLPSELLDRIIHHIDIALPCWGKSDAVFKYTNPRLGELRKLSLVSKTFQKAIEPYLYRDVTFARTVSMSSIRPFLRTMGARPDLARYVKSLSLRANTRQPDPAPSEQELDAYSTILDSIGSQKLRDQLWDSLTRGCVTAEAILIAALANNVQELRFRLYDGSEGRAIYGLIEHEHCKGCPNTPQCFATILAMPLDSAPGRYQNLKTVDLTSSPTQMAETSFNIPMQILQLPRIGELILRGLASGSDVKTVLSRNCNRVSILTLADCSFDSTSLADLLISCSRLTTFRFYQAANSVKIDGTKLATALGHHATSLETIAIMTPRKHQPVLQDQSAIPSLGALVNVKALEVDSDILTGMSRWSACTVPALPPAMAALKINTYSNLGDLPWILSALAPQLNSSLSLFEVWFPWRREGNGAYVHLIEEADLGDLKWLARADKSWIIMISTDGVDGSDCHCIKFTCWLKETSITDTISKVASQLNDVGIVHLLEDYYDGWDTPENSPIYHIRRHLDWLDDNGED